MARSSIPLLLALLCACSDSNSPDTLGQSDITAQGTIHFGTRTSLIDTDLGGIACARLGSLSFWSADRQKSLTFSPGFAGLTTGTFTVQWLDNGEPTGWLNAGPPSLLPVSGTTLITSVTDKEVRGAVDWVVAVPPDIGAPPDSTLGTVQVRGTFRAERVSGDVNCVDA